MDPEVWRVREGKYVFVDVSIITHYQISVADAVVGNTAATDRFHSSDRFLIRCPLDAFTSGYLRVFLQFCPFCESQWGTNMYIYWAPMICIVWA